MQGNSPLQCANQPEQGASSRQGVNVQDCVICQRQKKTDPAVVYETDRWFVRHSGETNILGYLLLESKRHFLDLSEATADECAEFGYVLQAVVAAVRAEVKPERVYTLTLAEAVPHFHVHIIPRTESVPRAYRGRGILSYPLHPLVDRGLCESICARLQRRIRTNLKGSLSRSPAALKAVY